MIDRTRAGETRVKDVFDATTYLSLPESVHYRFDFYVLFCQIFSHKSSHDSSASLEGPAGV